MEHRDAAANCSSDDEGVAAALAENGSNSEASGDDSDRVEAWEHGYMVDGFLVRDESEDEVFCARCSDSVRSGMCGRPSVTPRPFVKNTTVAVEGSKQGSQLSIAYGCLNRKGEAER